MSEDYNLEELLNEIFRNYYAIYITGLGAVARIEIKLLESSKLSKIDIERVGDLANITAFHKTPSGTGVAKYVLTKPHYEVLLNAAVTALKMMEEDND